MTLACIDLMHVHATLTIMCAAQTACVQCKSRPREVCIQMRQATLAQNPQAHSFAAAANQAPLQPCCTCS